MIPWCVLCAWHAIGGLALLILWTKKFSPLDNNNILSPVWIYNAWKLNYFGTGVVCLILNLLCPVLSILWWFCKLVKFICTVGRR